ncbi:MAG: helix-turn-helix domain-containing protein [Bacteriovoracia bacterium]
MINRQSEVETRILGAAIGELRKNLNEQNISQAAVGEALGLKQSAVSSLLRGQSKISVEQLLKIAKLAGIRPRDLFSKAETAMTQNIPMPYEIEEMLYKSEAHVLAYSAATRPVSISDLAKAGISVQSAKKAFDDLCSVGLLTKKKDLYFQTNPNRTYSSTSRVRRTPVHQRIMNMAWSLIDKKRESPDKEDAYRKARFNFYTVDRLTVAQVKELDAMLWRVYERVDQFQRDNMASGYSSDEPMKLWNVHLMMGTPLETD